MRLNVENYKILAPFVGVDLCKNFCNNKNPYHLGSVLYTEVFFLLIKNLHSKNKLISLFKIYQHI